MARKYGGYAPDEAKLRLCRRRKSWEDKSMPGAALAQCCECGADCWYALHQPVPGPRGLPEVILCTTCMLRDEELREIVILEALEGDRLAQGTLEHLHEMGDL